MSAVITMPSAIDESIRECCTEAVSQAVIALAAKYGFDAEEAERELNLGELKLQRKRGPVAKKSAAKPTKATKAAAADKPKKAMTGYLLFSKEMRPDVKAAMEAELEDGEKLKPQAVVTELAAQWKALDKDEQDEWKQRAAGWSPLESDEE